MIDRTLDLQLFENDFGVVGTFATTPTPTSITGIFTAASQGVALGGNVEVEAGKPSFTVRSAAAFGVVSTKTACTINGSDYLVERIEPVGNGYTVLWLKPSVT